MRILIADDSALLRTGLRLLLQEEGHDVVAELTSVEDLVQEVERSTPDLSVLDVRMPPTYGDEGIRAAIALRDVHPGAPVLVLSQFVENSSARELFESGTGGLGYLLKDRVIDVEALLDAVSQVAAGGTVLDPEVVAQLLVRGRGDDRLAELSPREREVLALLAAGNSNAGIAARLVITEGAVEKHVGNIFDKLGLLPAADQNRRVQAAVAWLTSARK